MYTPTLSSPITAQAARRVPTLFSVFENPNRSDQGLCHGGPLKMPIISVMPLSNSGLGEGDIRPEIHLAQVPTVHPLVT